jgi:methyl-accepting chemotaxis protein
MSFFWRLSGAVLVAVAPALIVALGVSEVNSSWMLGAVLLGLLLGVTFLWLVLRPFYMLLRLVEQGATPRLFLLRGEAEVGQLATAFLDALQRIKELSEQLTQRSTHLEESVSQLDATTSEQNKTLTQQAAALHEAQVTAQELNEISRLTSQKAETVLRVSERANEIGRSGEAAISQSLANLAEIRAQIADISNKIRALDERTKQIAIITETVKGFAEQSSMLALNAAIESVRSGEQGKGFSVVAREMRALADQSSEATKRVRSILEDISGAIYATVEINERSAPKLESSLSQMKTSGENLKELSGIVQGNTDAVRQIAAAVNQQSQGVSQLFTAIGDLTKLSESALKRLNTNEKSLASMRAGR